jgi:hypothetical protein
MFADNCQLFWLRDFWMLPALEVCRDFRRGNSYKLYRVAVK